MKINKYPDGTSYVTIPERWSNTIQDITFKVNNYEDVIHLVQLCDVLIYNRVKAHITIPCLIDAQADKRFGEFQSSGLTVIAEILKPYVDGNDISIGVFHPHNPEVVEALIDSVEIIDNSDFIVKVLYTMYTGENLDNYKSLILMSADAGGFKPLMKLCDKIDWHGETASASKARSYENGKTTLHQIVPIKDFEGKDILIVDDLSIYGGTFKGLSKILKERNCGKLYLAVSHMTIENLGNDPVTNYFDKVFTTNSKFNSYYYTFSESLNKKIYPNNLEVIKLF
jgi:ribose-phosphate pyrophosphokinase